MAATKRLMHTVMHLERNHSIMPTNDVGEICVVYAIRQNDGIESFIRFIESCERFPMSISSQPKLVVAVKESTVDFESQIRNYAEERKQNICLIRVPDWGSAFGSWRTIIENETNDLYVLLTATSKATRDYWVDSLTQGFIDPEVGIIASMCSSESIRDTYRFAQLLRIKLFLRIRLSNYEADIADIFKLRTSTEMKSEPIYIKSSYFLNFLSSQLRNIVLFLTKSRGDWSWKRTFPKSPNIHFRTTGFAIRGETYRKIMKSLPIDKAENLALETGHNSFTRQVEKFGLKVKIFSSTDGLVDLRSQSAHRTFRWIGGDSIVVDAHSNEFASFSLRRQLSLQILSHGNIY